MDTSNGLATGKESIVLPGQVMSSVPNFHLACSLPPRIQILVASAVKIDWTWWK